MVLDGTDDVLCWCYRWEGWSGFEGLIGIGFKRKGL